MIACRECGQAFEPGLAGHRVMCGDSTDARDIDVLTGGLGADLCFTSPPYGQQRDYKTGVADWDALMMGVFSALPMAFGGQVLVNLGMIHDDSEWRPYWHRWIEWMRTQGWRRFGWYVWDQGPGLPGDWNGRLAPSFEFVFHFNREAERARKTVKTKYGGRETHLRKDGSSTAMRNKAGEVGSWQHAGIATQDKRIPDSVIRVMRHKARGIEVQHPAVFPVALCTEIITAFSDPGAIVFEPFGGSGTQIISAEQNGRVCWAMELAPAYVDVAVRRWMLHGGTAVLAMDGRSFEQVARDRSGS